MKNKDMFINSESNYEQIIRDWNRFAQIEKPYVYVNEDFDFYPDDLDDDLDGDDNDVMLIGTNPNEKSHKDRSSKYYKQEIPEDENIEYEIIDDPKQASITFVDLIPEEE